MKLREATLSDLDECGRVIFKAFTQLDERHGFPRDFAAEEEAIDLTRPLLENPSIFGVLAEDRGRVVGCNFLDERDPIRAVGPTTIDPGAQGDGIGRLLMEAVLERCREAEGVRLTQDAYNVTSLALYASLGFQVKEPLVFVEGVPTGRPVAGVNVRSAQISDLDRCADLCEELHGHARRGELADALAARTAFVAIRDGHVAAYTSGLSLFGHSVARSETDMRALILSVADLISEPVGFIVPTRRSPTLRWCLAQGLRLLKPMTLMALGAYRRPAGSWFPSAMY